MPPVPLDRPGPTHPGPDARLTLRPAADARLTGGLLHSRRQVNARVSVPDGHERLVSAGNFHNLRLAAGRAEGEYRNELPFLDSDLYKWLEAIGWLRADGELPAAESARLDGWVDEAVELLAAAQEPSGYLQSYFQVSRPDAHFTDLEWGHELYCAGHLIQAAVAHARAGRTDLLDIAVRVADHVDDVFGPGRRAGVCGHPEIETALVELYRTTGTTRYLVLAKHFVDQRGKGLLRADRFGGEYWQDHLPVREAPEVTGHVVRQLYLLAAVADLAVETGDADLLAAARRLCADMAATRTYLTGGAGAHHKDEAFGDPYELPNDRAYNETCAAIASIQLNWRMLLATGESHYADLLERALYNGFLAGVALSGDHYRYDNPLHVRDGYGSQHGDHGAARTPWFHCACCPPNIMRLLASLPHYLAAADDSGLVLHQFAPGAYRAGPMAVEVETEYPLAGTIAVRIGRCDPEPGTLTLRIPDWATEYRVLVNGQETEERGVDGWLRLDRRWTPGDTVTLDLDLTPRLTAAHPRVDAARGCLAIERGPLVYCVEAVDNGAVDDLVLDPDAPLHAVPRPDLLDGTVLVTGTARRTTPDPRPWRSPDAPESGAATTVPVTAVPYHLWGNRGTGAMRVWLRAGRP